ncbi:hypothetical protein GF348_07990 [candidate division KSB3 bacterium]|nr:hypothetical protein [candidate division KSB3 bacterium]
MLLMDVEKHYIEPMSRAEKEQLIRDVQRMLVDEEIEQHGEELLRQMFPRGMVYDITTPNVTPDASDVEAFAQLRQEREHAI